MITAAHLGVAVPPGDPRALADAILRVVRDRDFAEECGKCGRQYVIAHYRWSQLVKQWLDKLLELNSHAVPKFTAKAGSAQLQTERKFEECR